MEEIGTIDFCKQYSAEERPIVSMLGAMSSVMYSLGVTAIEVDNKDFEKLSGVKIEKVNASTMRFTIILKDSASVKEKDTPTEDEAGSGKRLMLVFPEEE